MRTPLNLGIQLVITNEVSPRDSQDDKIFPKHPKFNPKVKSFELWYYKNLYEMKIRKCV